MKISRCLIPLVCALIPLVLPALRAQDNVGSAPAGPVGDAAALRGLDYEHRAEFVAAVRDLVVKSDARMAQLATYPAGVPANMQRLEVLDEARGARLVLEHQLGKVNQAAPGSWVAVRESVLSALGEVQEACNRAARI